MTAPSTDSSQHPALARHQAMRNASTELRVADGITAFSGSMRFVYIHIAWFAVWVALNLVGPRFDPFPFGLLTMLVSLEAIFLSTFVLLSQNRAEERQHLVVADHYRETKLLEELLRENTRLTEDIHALVADGRQPASRGAGSDR